MKFVKPLTETEIDTLDHMHRHHPSRRARLRAHCILLSHQRYKLNDIAQIHQVARRRVSIWIDRWHECGLVGLYDQPGSGRPPIYNDQEQQQLGAYLQVHPRNVKHIIEEMAKDTHKRVTPKTMKRYIKKSVTFGNGSERLPKNHPIPSSTSAVNS